MYVIQSSLDLSGWFVTLWKESLYFWLSMKESSWKGPYLGTVANDAHTYEMRVACRFGGITWKVNRRFRFSRRRGFSVSCFPSLCIMTVRSCLCTMEVQFFSLRWRNVPWFLEVIWYKRLRVHAFVYHTFVEMGCCLPPFSSSGLPISVSSFHKRCQASRGCMILSTVTLQLEEIHQL